MTRFEDVVNYITNFLGDLIPVIVTIALLYFLWGVVQFIKAEGKDRDTARQKIIYGLVGLFVMVSVWGLVAVLANTFDLNNTLPILPRL